MADFLDVLGHDAKETVNTGYYKAVTETTSAYLSLKEAVLKCRKAPIIAEIKVASPTLGVIRKNADVREFASAMERGGAIGISFLTEPKHFGGSLDAFTEVRDQVKLPLLMKDIIVSRVQIEAASKIGANAVLLIEPLFKRGYCECDIHSMIAYGHSLGLEVLLEAHAEEEFLSALKTEADMIGINNRNLRNMEVDLNVTREILTNHRIREKLIVSESGIQSTADVRFLRQCGAHAFLVGSSIMRASDIEVKVREFVTAL
ncbi:MAG: indole-3-glycerol-phosphate synthase [Candidatus Bathyarchaeota archaeon]|jgi:indole-3-glycerol phosphate synthase|nr:indole-3-glycerol-phosphate synthase [Candidatus Bathyarchaeota archaeon]